MALEVSHLDSQELWDPQPVPKLTMYSDEQATLGISIRAFKRALLPTVPLTVHFDSEDYNAAFFKGEHICSNHGVRETTVFL